MTRNIFSQSFFEPNESFMTKIVISSISPDKSLIAVNYDDTDLKILNNCHFIKWSPDGSYIAVTRGTRDLFCYETTNWTLTFRSSSNSYRVRWIEISQSNKLYQANILGSNELLREWELATGVGTNLSNDGRFDNNDSISFKKDDETKLLFGRDDRYFVWDLTSNSLLYERTDYSASVSDISMERSDIYSFIGGKNPRTIEFVDYSTGDIINTITVDDDLNIQIHRTFELYDGFALFAENRDSNPNRILVYDDTGSELVQTIDYDITYKGASKNYNTKQVLMNNNTEPKIVVLTKLDYCVKGQVLDGGAGVQGVKIGCVEQDTNTFLGHQTTDVDGNYKFQNLRDDYRYNVFVSDETLNNGDGYKNKPYIAPVVDNGGN